MRTERAQAVAQGLRERALLSPTTRALEFGCGTGLLSFALAEDLGEITLADNSTGMLAEVEVKIAAAARATAGNQTHMAKMSTLKLDLSTDPLPSQRFDLVYTLMTLHHLLDTAQILRAFCNLLVPGGYACLADLDQEDGSFHEEPFQGHFGFDRRALTEMLLAAGFQTAEFSTVYQMTKIRNSEKRTYPVFLATARKP
jgi:ubiquinone/menaquinone biosynthesis C-methylase UbiE